MELQAPKQWWLSNEVSSPKQPSRREERREGKQPTPMPAPKAAGCAQLERWLCRD